MKKRLKTEAFLAVLFALLCQVLEMFVFKNGTPNFVMNFYAFPVRMSFLLFEGNLLKRPELVQLYESLPFETADKEARRNAAIRMPYLWF